MVGGLQDELRSSSPAISSSRVGGSSGFQSAGGQGGG